MKRSFVVVGQLLVLLVVVLPTSNASAPPIAAFAGTNHFSSTRSGEAVLHLTESVKVSTDPFGNKLARIRSTGQVAGLMLKQDVPKNGVEIIALSVALCAKPPCKERRLNYTQVWDPSNHGFPRNVTLPSGDYFVRLITDGYPTDVDLTFSGLSGETTQDLSATQDVDVAAPKTTFDPLPEHNVYSAEAKQTLGGMGWAILAVEVEAEGRLYGEIETCLQEKRSDPVRAHLSVGFFFTSCDGSGAGSTAFGLPTGPNREVVVELTSLDAGTYFHSLAYKTVAEVQAVNSIAVNVEFPRGERSGGRSAGVFHSDEG
ncbi:MAG TPA: hypothetical protein VNP73_01410 [Actinomycetota bacterium]|nr:hypothetical protein [Actinomycetota bacterium]